MNALAQDARYRLRQVARSYRLKLAHVERQLADPLAQREAHRSHPLIQPPILAELDRLQAQAEHLRRMCRRFAPHHTGLNPCQN